MIQIHCRPCVLPRVVRARLDLPAENARRERLETRRLVVGSEEPQRAVLSGVPDGAHRVVELQNLEVVAKGVADEDPAMQQRRNNATGFVIRDCAGRCRQVSRHKARDSSPGLGRGGEEWGLAGSVFVV